MKKDRQTEARRERIIMVAASAFVMAALTLTGVYVRNRSVQEQDDGYSIDFSQLENGDDLAQGGQSGETSLENPNGDLALDGAGDNLGDLALGDMAGDDLDYDPMSEVDSNLVEIPGLTDKDSKDKSSDKDASGEKASGNETSDDQASANRNDSKDKSSKDGQQEDDLKENAQANDQTDDEANVQNQDLGANPGEVQEELQTAQPAEETSARTLEFADGQSLVRPTSGEVLMHYSMNGSVYFATLDQYKYNPAVMLAATEGDSVRACAEGQVIAIFQDEEIGQAVTLNLGNGYQATYGQLQNLTVELGGYVNSGDILGYVAAPTKYFVVEGTNLYFRLTKDGIPVNPEELFS